MVEDDNDTELTCDLLDFEDRDRSYSRAGPRRTGFHQAAGDGLTDILETLYSEHRYISSLLEALEQEAARLKPRRIPDYHLLLDIIDYLTHYPDQYHHPREDILFGKMAARDKEFAPLLARLEREHKTLQAYNHELFNELTRIASGHAVDRPKLLRSIENYIDGYRQHMDYESREIFPRAKGSLTPADRKILGDKTHYIDDPLFGGELLYRYRRLGRSLGARLDIAGQDLVTREFSAIQDTIEKLSSVVDAAARVKALVKSQSRQSWRDQKATIRDHTRFGDGPNIAFLPFALMKEQGRHWKEGIAGLRQILRESADSDTGSSGKH